MIAEAPVSLRGAARPFGRLDHATIFVMIIGPYAALVRSGPFQHPAEAAAPRKVVRQQTAVSHKAEPGSRSRQAPAGANVRREEVIPAGSVPAFLRRPPANRADPGGRRPGRRDSQAARSHGAR